jgi:hypothetical protein
VDPHLRFSLHRGIRDELKLVPLVDLVHMTIAAGEDGPVDRGPKEARLAFGEWRRRS